MSTPLPPAWEPVLSAEVTKPSFLKLQQFLQEERQQQHTVFPPEPDVFSALALTRLEDVKVLLLGQDPYHEAGQAHGLSFSVRPHVKVPPSLANMFKELESDVPPFHTPTNGFLEPWAQRGVLLLNTVLTVREGVANSHKGKGWEQFTDAIIRAVNAQAKPTVFMLLGRFAQTKEKLIDNPVHKIVRAGHPSPLTQGFRGTRVFSKTNKALRAAKREIDWRLPDVP